MHKARNQKRGFAVKTTPEGSDSPEMTAPPKKRGMLFVLCRTKDDYHKRKPKQDDASSNREKYAKQEKRQKKDEKARK